MVASRTFFAHEYTSFLFQIGARLLVIPIAGRKKRVWDIACLGVPHLVIGVDFVHQHFKIPGMWILPPSFPPGIGRRINPTQLCRLFNAQTFAFSLVSQLRPIKEQEGEEQRCHLIHLLNQMNDEIPHKFLHLLCFKERLVLTKKHIRENGEKTGRFGPRLSLALLFVEEERFLSRPLNLQTFCQIEMNGTVGIDVSVDQGRECSEILFRHFVHPGRGRTKIPTKMCNKAICYIPYKKRRQSRQSSLNPKYFEEIPRFCSIYLIFFICIRFLFFT